MSSPRLICKSGYITDITHVFSLLEYSGNKIAAQQIIFKDGSAVDVNAEEVISLSDADLDYVAGIKIVFKDGGEKTISYDTYRGKTMERRDVIRYSDITEVRDDSRSFKTGSAPHEMKDLDFFLYLPYIEGRDGAVKEDGHGLFGLTGNIPIEDAKSMALKHEKSRKWSHIISMDARDAADTGFNSREAWKHLIVSKAPEIAKAYNISMENLVINCAYHANTDNPHVHLLFYSTNSTDSSEGFIKGGTKEMNKATEKLKSTLVNTIFKNEAADLGKEKTVVRDLIKENLLEHMRNLANSPSDELCAELETLSLELREVGGRMAYEYLPPTLKERIDRLLEQTIKGNTDLDALFSSYCEVQERMVSRYATSPEAVQGRMEKFKSEFFHPKKKDLKLYHNLIVGAAAKLANTRAAWQRTTEEKIADDNTSEYDLSTESFVDAADEGRTADGENVDGTIAEYDLSTESFDDAVDEQRTTEEEIHDDTIASRALSTKNKKTAFR